ncbi:MAG TPA: RNA polymerase sigma factor [Solirubrobacteraceae bacterium]|jgi:RNA polymerase sigma-70 factor (ECF subfamily)
MAVRIDDERQFEESFRALAGHVYAYALRRADPDVAQDVTAETFLIAWRRRGRLPAEPLPWLYGIARRVLANERRSANRRAALEAHIAAQPARAVSGERHGLLEALARLSERDREVLLLTAWEGLSTQEAARATGCTSAALAVRLHRARRRLAQTLAEGAAEADPTPPTHPVPEVSA